MRGERNTNIKSYFYHDVAKDSPSGRHWRIYKAFSNNFFVFYSNDKIPLFTPVYIHTISIHNPFPKHKNVDYVHKMQSSESPETVSDKLKFYRCKNGYLQSEIADYINVDRTTYIRYEENVLSVYPIDKIILLAKLYKVDVCDLLDDYNKFLYNCLLYTSPSPRD